MFLSAISSAKDELILDPIEFEAAAQQAILMAAKQITSLREYQQAVKAE